MFPLVQKEFVQLRRQLLQYLAVITVAILVFGRFEPSVGMAYITIFPLVLATTLPQASFMYEERENTFAFLRTLPIPPGQIVGSKYVFSALITVLLELLIILGSLFYPEVAEYGLWAMVSITTLIAMFLSSLSLLLHFTLGLKSARTALLVVIMLIALPFGALQASNVDGAGLIGGWATDVLVLLNSLAGVLVAAGVSAVLMLASWYASTQIFSRRDLSKMV